MTPQSHRVIIRIEAEVDITDAAIWYQNQQPGLGHDFLTEVESAIARAAEIRSATRVFAESRRCAGYKQSCSPTASSSSAATTPSSSSASSTAPAHDREWESNVPND